MSKFGYKPKATQEPAGALKDGEIVKVLILDMTYPSSYLKSLDEFNSNEKRIADSMGLDYSPKLPTHKEGGLQVNYAVITRGSDGQMTERVFKESPDGLIEPPYTCYGSLTQLAPKELFEKKWDYQRRGGGTKLNKLGKPTIVDLLPNASVVKDWSAGVSADEIPAGQEEHFKDLLDKEAERLIEWEEFLKQYESLTEDEALEWLMDCMSSRFLICHVDDDIIAYVPAVKGTTFTAMIAKKDKYLNLVPFKYNSNSKSFIIYSKLNSKYPSDDSIAYANEIIELKETQKEIRNRKKSEEPVEPDEQIENSNDEDPF